MTEFRCEKCGKLLAKVAPGYAIPTRRPPDVEIKCPRCKAINTKTLAELMKD